MEPFGVFSASEGTTLWRFTNIIIIILLIIIIRLLAEPHALRPWLLLFLISTAQKHRLIQVYVCNTLIVLYIRNKLVWSELADMNCCQCQCQCKFIQRGIAQCL